MKRDSYVFIAYPDHPSSPQLEQPVVVPLAAAGTEFEASVTMDAAIMSVEDTRTRGGTEASCDGIQDIIRSLRTKWKKASKAVITNYDWLLQAAVQRMEVVIAAWGTQAEYYSELISHEEIDEAEILRATRTLHESSNDTMRAVQAARAEILALKERLRTDLAIIEGFLAEQAAAAIEARSYHTL